MQRLTKLWTALVILAGCPPICLFGADSTKEPTVPEPLSPAIHEYIDCRFSLRLELGYQKYSQGITHNPFDKDNPNYDATEIVYRIPYNRKASIFPAQRNGYG